MHTPSPMPRTTACGNIYVRWKTLHNTLTWLWGWFLLLSRKHYIHLLNRPSMSYNSCSSIKAGCLPCEFLCCPDPFWRPSSVEKTHHHFGSQWNQVQNKTTDSICWLLILWVQRIYCFSGVEKQQRAVLWKAFIPFQIFCIFVTLPYKYKIKWWFHLSVI